MGRWFQVHPDTSKAFGSHHRCVAFPPQRDREMPRKSRISGMSWHPNSAVETTKVCIQQATGASGADTATLLCAPAEGQELCSEKEIH